MDMNSFHYQTSEKIKIEYEIAGAPIRIVAAIIDMAILVFGFFILYFLAIFLFLGSFFLSKLFNSNISIYVMIIIYLLIGLFYITYPFFFELFWKGQTPGKRIMNIRAVNDDGSYLTFSSLLLRNLFRIVDMLPVGNLLGTIILLCNKRRKRLGDFVAGTIVVREPNISLPVYTENLKDDPFQDIKNIRNKFSEQDCKNLNSYFAVRKDLSDIALIKIETTLVGLIEKKSMVRKPAKMSNRDFITAVYKNLG